MRTKSFQKKAVVQLVTEDIAKMKPKDMPVARYFQVHFEQLHTQLSEMQMNLQQLQLQIKQLNKQN